MFLVVKVFYFGEGSVSAQFKKGLILKCDGIKFLPETFC